MFAGTLFGEILRCLLAIIISGVLPDAGSELIAGYVVEFLSAGLERPAMTLALLTPRPIH
jgi:hypothetical protein